MTIMNSNVFVGKAIDIANNYNTLYVMGCFGAPLVGSNVNRYCNNHSYNKKSSRTKMIKSVADKNPPYYGFDCVCLIKGILWGWNGDVSKTYGGAKYSSNDVPDVSADGMIKKCYDVSTNFSNIVVGEVVWMSGHIGIYIGNGLAIEATPSWDNKVQITAVKNIGTKSGYNARKWTNHGKLPYINYSTQTPSITPNPTTTRSYLMKGDTGEEVKILQENLNYIGYSCGNADGNFGIKTETALMKFQDSYNLTVDGKYGSVSKKTLENAVAKKKASYNTTSKFIYKSVDYSPVFDPTFYANEYSDLKSAFGTNVSKLWNHFTTHGMVEGRQAHAKFNVNIYKNRYDDLQKAFGSNLPAYYQHYCQFGEKEGRSAL